MPRPKILIVEDDDLTSALLKGTLAREGYGITLAGDGLAALELLGDDPGFAAVLLDRLMPGMDGLQVLKRMKATPGLKDIPVVLETALDGDEDIREGLKAGALHYLVKPLDPRMVVQVVAAAVGEFETKKKLYAELDSIRAAMGLVRRGVFHVHTLEQCGDLAALLAKACPDPRRSVTGILELLINAVEHGNLGITYAEKTALIAAHGGAGEIERRQELPENRKRRVEVTLTRLAGATRIRIQDMGAGFHWQDFEGVDPGRMFDSHGRGILLAKWEAFDRVDYLGNGNCVVAEIAHP
jgi:CheY-like chemotaxis protein